MFDGRDDSPVSIVTVGRDRRRTARKSDGRAALGIRSFVRAGDGRGSCGFLGRGHAQGAQGRADCSQESSARAGGLPGMSGFGGRCRARAAIARGVDPFWLEWTTTGGKTAVDYAVTGRDRYRRSRANRALMARCK